MLVVAFPHRPDIAAAAWGIMAFGDGAATLVGTPGRGAGPIPWNPDKTMAGSAAFVVAGALAGAALAWWTRPAVSPAAAACCSRWRPRPSPPSPRPASNRSACGSTTTSRCRSPRRSCWAASRSIDGASWAAARAALPPLLAYAALVNVPVAALGWRAGTVTAVGRGGRRGDRRGGVRGRGAGRVGAAVRVVPGRHRLDAARPQEEVGARDRRSRAAGVAGRATRWPTRGSPPSRRSLAALSPYREGALLAMTAALVAGASDTVASEIGKAWGTAHLPVSRR